MAYNNTTLRTKNKILTLEELHLSKENRDKINQLIEEFTYAYALKEFDIPIDNKILLYGKTGCGKTATANAIGKALNKEVITLNLAGFVSSRLGETGKNISEVFRKASYNNAVLFIDEFDFIGKIRDYDNKDSGEMKRLVNTLIQQIDNLSNTSLLICATNHLEIIDTALLRRFQLKLKYELPNNSKLDNYYDDILVNFPKNINNIKRTYNISYAEAKDITYQQIKTNIIESEKQKKHFLFLDESLLSEKVQVTIYGKKLQGEKIKLNNLKTENTRKNQTLNEENYVKGEIFEITTEELFKTDLYKGNDYKRVLKTFTPELKAWIYIKK